MSSTDAGPNPERSLFAFAGIWCTWHGTRGTQKAPEQGEHLLYGFLTTEANGVVAPVHAKAIAGLNNTHRLVPIPLGARSRRDRKIVYNSPDQRMRNRRASRGWWHPGAQAPPAPHSRRQYSSHRPALGDRIGVRGWTR
jgi:hypothetical protein